MTLTDPYEFEDHEMDMIEEIVECMKEQYRLTIEINQSMEEDLSSTDQLDELLGRKQIEQRTEEWYKQMAEVISASELGTLFAAPRQRAKLVMSKTVPYPIRNNYLAVPSTRMSAFDWGIRFEPVVKQIYEHKYGAVIRELGRLHHPIDPRCTASPDGLIYSATEGNRKGRLIEIKCPVSREITDVIPKDYYAQMQMQLQVTGLKSCDYVEAAFSSPYNDVPMKEGNAIYSGQIALVQYTEPVNGQVFRYEYSPVNAPEEWKPTIADMEDIVEMIPWKLVKWSEHLVTKNESWWNSLQPILEAFWQDVEKAKRGEFTIPESTRPSKKPKMEIHLWINQRTQRKKNQRKKNQRKKNNYSLYHCINRQMNNCIVNESQEGPRHKRKEPYPDELRSMNQDDLSYIDW
jgi:putative phage-type endonuclease